MSLPPVSRPRDRKVPAHLRTPFKKWLWTRGLSLHRRLWHVAPESWARRYIDRRLNQPDTYWLFIAGLTNSGTSLLVRILRMYPRFRTLPTEGMRYTDALGSVTELRRVYARRLDAIRLTEENDPAPALRMKYDLAYCYEPRPGPLLEKSTPNTLRTRWLQANFQPAKFIALYRNPYAVCEGIRRRRGGDLREIAEHWSVCNNILADDTRHLRHCLSLTYEQFTADPVAVVRRIENFLEITDPLADEQIRGDFSVHNVLDRPSPIRDFNAESIARLTDQEIQTITEAAAPAMARLGYEPPVARPPAPVTHPNPAAT